MLSNLTAWLRSLFGPATYKDFQPKHSHKRWGCPCADCYPSGIDMTRDHSDRLSMFAERPVEVRRLALNYDQVEAYNPPPNPARMSDPRAVDYVAIHGEVSWELDALSPNVIANIVRDELDSIRLMDPWQERLDFVAEERARLNTLTPPPPTMPDDFIDTEDEGRDPWNDDQ